MAEPPDEIDTMQMLIQGILGALTKGVEMIGEDEVGQLRITTVNSHDLGWETAIAKVRKTRSGPYPTSGPHPVERYLNEEEALAGHQRWVERAHDGLTRITRLGYGIAPAKTIDL